MRLILLLFFILGSNANLTAEEKLLTLSDATRKLVIDDRTSEDYFLCLMDGKKVFGKNPAKTSECYSLKEQDLAVSMELFLQLPKEEEMQVGFYTSEGKQVIPYWEENGQRILCLSFVLRKSNQLFLQALRKDTKQYFFWKTFSGNWEILK